MAKGAGLPPVCPRAREFTSGAGRGLASDPPQGARVRLRCGPRRAGSPQLCPRAHGFASGVAAHEAAHALGHEHIGGHQRADAGVLQLDDAPLAGAWGAAVVE
eukprot:3764111-Prymnesium_polylepis.1